MMNFQTTNNMMNSPMMDYYLIEAQKGNADAAYEAAKLTALDDKNDVYFVQKRFIRAAELGDERAQRILGILGLSRHLITDDSIYGNVNFNTDRRAGFNWLNEAACSGDVLSTYLIGCCHLHGIGTEKNCETAERYFRQIIHQISIDVIIETMLLFEAITFDADLPKNVSDMGTAKKDIIDKITAIAS